MRWVGPTNLRNEGSDFSEASADESLEGLQSRLLQLIVPLGGGHKGHDEGDHRWEVGSHPLSRLATEGEGVRV